MLRIFVLVAICGLASSLSSQPVPEKPLRDQISPDRITIEKRGKRPPDFDRNLALVRRLMNIRQMQQAADLLEVITESSPNHPVVLNLLRSCYASLKQYEKAELLARKMLASSPKNNSYLLFLAEMLAEQNKREEATEIYDQALNLLSPNQAGRYQQTIFSMKRHGFENKALGLIDSIRILSGDALLFAAERGSLLENQNRYGEAAAEYLPLLAQDTTIAAGNAEKRLLALLSFVESSVEVEELLLSEAKNLRGVRAARLLAAHYLKAGQLDQAYLFSLRQDSLQGNTGSVLFRFMDQCRERKTFAPMLRMAEYMTASDSLFRNRTRVLMYLGSALDGMEKYGESIAAYQELLLTAPTSIDSGEAMFAIGKIYMDNLKEYDNAISYFDSVTTNHRRGRTYIQALMITPQCYLRAGNISKAHRKYSLLRPRISGDDVVEEIDFNMALIDFFEARYDSCEAKLRKLIVDFPRGFYVNDALQLVLLMGEAGGEETLLADFSKAIYYETLLLPDSSKIFLNRLADASNNALADVALFRLAKMAVGSGINLSPDKSMDAIYVIDRLVEGYPDSYYLPFGLKMKADILAGDESSLNEAIEIYRLLLENHSKYPFISKVRKIVRELKDEQPVG